MIWVRKWKDHDMGEEMEMYNLYNLNDTRTPIY